MCYCLGLRQERITEYKGAHAANEGKLRSRFGKVSFLGCGIIVAVVGAAVDRVLVILVGVVAVVEIDVDVVVVIRWSV